MTFSRIALSLLTLLCLAFVAWGVWVYPYARLELGLGLLAYAALGLWRPHLLLFALPVWLALVNLAPWSGSMYLEDYDLVLAATLAVFLSTGHYVFRIRLTCAHWSFLALLILSYLISTLRGLWPVPPLDGVELSTYYSHWHAVRLAKGFFWALLLLPALVALLRDRYMRARLILTWGLAVAGGAMGLVAMWERGVFNAALESGSLHAVLSRLLDFGTKYRVTGLFSEMHTGGEAIDSFMALTWPFGLLAAAHAKKRRWVWLGGLLFALAVYAIVTTFSRSSYLGLFVGLVMAAAIYFYPHAMRKTTRWQDFLTLLGVLTPLGLTLLYTPAGFYPVFIGLLGWAGCLWGGVFSARKSLLLGIPVAILAVAAAAWGMKQTALFPDFPVWILLFLALFVGVGGYWAGLRLVRQVGYKGVAVTMILVVGCIAAVTPALLGARMEKRLAGNRVDMVTRENHWRDTIELMPPNWTTWLFGMGVGRFPAEYLFSGIQSNIGTYQFRRETDGNVYLALGSGEDARMTQRVVLPAGRNFTLSLDARTDAPRLWLRAMFYRRNILQQSDTPPDYRELNKHLENTGGKWQRVTWQFNIGLLGERGWTGRQPLVLEFMNWHRYEYHDQPRTVVEIDNVSLKDDQGREWLVNGTFSRAMERWFPYYDFNHLPWHIKNLWVHIYFDQGVLGVLSLSGFLIATLVVAVRRARQGNAWGFAVSTAMASYLAVGLFGGLLDMPRVITVAYLMLLVTALSGPSRAVWGDGQRLAALGGTRWANVGEGCIWTLGGSRRH